MEKRFFQWIGFGFAVVALLAICAGLMNGISNNFTVEKKGDLATWVGAIFTGAAFAVTIWIATSSERRRRAEKLDLAHVMAAAFIERLNLARSRLAHVDQYLSFRVYQTTMLQANPDTAVNMASYCLEFLKDFPIWSSDELLAAAPLESHCASHIAAAMGRLQGVRTLLEIARDGRVLQTVGIRHHLEETIGGIGTAILSLDIAIDVCEEAVRALNVDVQMRFEQQER